jgi:hypothetical protein
MKEVTKFCLPYIITKIFKPHHATKVTGRGLAAFQPEAEVGHSSAMHSAPCSFNIFSHRPSYNVKYRLVNNNSICKEEFISLSINIFVL